MEDYPFNEHKHRYAVWTAARAVQRSFTTTANIKTAIEASGLRIFAESQNEVTIEEFDELHTLWCNTLINSFLPLKCSYGRAAKIVSIYLKTAVVIASSGSHPNCKIIHPPIDSILLTGLSKLDGLKDLSLERWTTLNEKQYQNVVNTIKTHFGFFNWRIEKYWNPERAKAYKAILKEP